MRPVLAHLAAFPVSGEAQFRAVDGAMPHWSHIGDTRPPRLPVQERGTGAVLRSCQTKRTTLEQSDLALQEPHMTSPLQNYGRPTDFRCIEDPLQYMRYHSFDPFQNHTTLEPVAW